MNKIIIAFLIFLPFTGFCQTKKIKQDLVPESVQNGYKDKYKKIPVNNWYENTDGYSALFDKGQSTYQAFFTNDGQWVRTVCRIKEAAVSGPVKKAIKGTEWKDWKLTECYKVETPQDKKLFELHMKKKKEKKILVFDPMGKAVDIK